MTLIGATSESTNETMLLLAQSTRSATLPPGASGLSVMVTTVAPGIVRVLQQLYRAAGIARQADADDDVFLPHAQQLLKHLACGRGGDEADVVKNIAEIEIEVVGQRRGRADADDIDVPRGQDRPRRPLPSGPRSSASLVMRMALASRCRTLETTS